MSLYPSCNSAPRRVALCLSHGLLPALLWLRRSDDALCKRLLVFCQMLNVLEPDARFCHGVHEYRSWQHLVVTGNNLYSLFYDYLCSVLYCDVSYVAVV
jgi:hypothetical protein